MKQIPLKEAYAKATPGKALAHPMHDRYRDAKTTHYEIQCGEITMMAHTPLESVNPAGFKRRQPNAALLAHAFNVLPEVVEAGDNALKLLDLFPMPDEGSVKEAQLLEIRGALRLALTRASSVQIP